MVRALSPGAYNLPVEIHASLAAALNAVVTANGTDLALSIGTPPMVRLDGNDPAGRRAARRRRRADGGVPPRPPRRRTARGALEGPRHRLRVLVGQLPLPWQRVLPARSAGGRAAAHPARDPDVRRDRRAVLGARAHRATTRADPVHAVRRVPESRPRWPRWSTRSTTRRPCHILTIEDPIEYLHHNKQAVVHQREVGIDAQSFDRVRCARHSAKTPTSCSSARCATPRASRITLTLAETGHLVLSSLHTNDAPAGARPHRRRVHRRSARARSGSSSRARSPAVVNAAARAQGRRRPHGRVRGADRDVAGPQPDP